jgi:hypothetical protein
MVHITDQSQVLQKGFLTRESFLFYNEFGSELVMHIVT